MANKGVQVVEVVVVDGKPVVRGTVGEAAFEASTFQWGSKMLMKVDAEALDRTVHIAERCQFVYDTKTYYFPASTPPDVRLARIEAAWAAVPVPAPEDPG